MAYDEKLAVRMRRALSRLHRITEKKMFGGICFLLRDHMLCGLGKPGFMFRVGKEREAEALARPGASPMKFNGRRFGGFVWVDPGRCTDRDLRGLIVLARNYLAELPPKKRRKRV